MLALTWQEKSSDFWKFIEHSICTKIAPTPHDYMVPTVRKGINEWRKKQPVNLSLTNRLDFAGRSVPADSPNKIGGLSCSKSFAKIVAVSTCTKLGSMPVSASRMKMVGQR